MQKTTVTLQNKLGLHARAANQFVEAASRFSSKIEVSKDDKVVNGKSIMSMMMLAATQGTPIEISVDGDDEHEALQSLTSLVQNRFGEEE